MNDKSMRELQTNHIEIAAKAWAGAKAREVAGVTVDAVISRTKADVGGIEHIPLPEDIRRTEEHMERWLSAWLAQNLLEWNRIYQSALEEQVDALTRRIEQAFNVMPTPPFIQKP